MQATEIVSALQNCKGAHVKVVWQRACKTKKNSPLIAKRTVAHVRAGIDYANLRQVKEAIEAKERGEVQSLPWGEWELFPFIIAHNGIKYLRLYPSVFDNLRPVSEFTRNGMPVRLEDVKEFLYSSELPNGERPDCFTVKADSIVEIG